MICQFIVTVKVIFTVAKEPYYEKHSVTVCKRHNASKVDKNVWALLVFVVNFRKTVHTKSISCEVLGQKCNDINHILIMTSQFLEDQQWIDACETGIKIVNCSTAWLSCQWKVTSDMKNTGKEESKLPVNLSGNKPWKLVATRIFSLNAVTNCQQFCNQDSYLWRGVRKSCSWSMPNGSGTAAVMALWRTVTCKQQWNV